MPVDVDVIEDPKRAEVMLHPARLRILENLSEPASPAVMAKRLGLPRQIVNYHLRELEAQRLVEKHGERRRGSVVERTYRRTGQAYVVSTAALGRIGVTPQQFQDRFSSAFQIALASRAVRELGAMQVAARAAGKALPTLTLEVDVRFATPAARNAFAEELSGALASLAKKYHDEEAPEGRAFRVYVGSYPRPKETKDPGDSMG